MSIDLPPALAEKVAEFPESAMGANRVTLVLRSGERVTDVTLAWGRTIVRVSDRDVAINADLGFDIAEIDDVEPDAE